MFRLENKTVKNPNGSQTGEESSNELIASVPAVTESPSFPYFTPEERIVVESLLCLSPDAGWHGQIPMFTHKYEYLHSLTGHFALNGQPAEVEKRRVWHTQFKSCEVCGGVSAQWIDRYLLTAGSYCDRCHKDTPLGSYLEIELNRLLPKRIQSTYRGYLSNNPDFDDFDLWQPHTLTYLGAAMSTGKTTEIVKAIRESASRGGKGIIAVPRVSLARFLAYQLRNEDGSRAWGVWHEGSERSDRFVGTLGAICCLPSLSRVVERAREQGVAMESLYIAVDELDFGYELFSLAAEQAIPIKQTLREAVKTKGLVIAGQTVYTTAIEAFADEMECDNVRGFYNTALQGKGAVELRKYPDSNGKSIDMLAGVAESIENHLNNKRNVYIFCDIRRDAEVLAGIFEKYKPVLYTGKTKGDPRADAVLKNQRLTDTSLFIGTSAAGIGISIQDERGVTEILTGLQKGRRNPSMTVQKAMRNRCRNDITIHYTDYKFKLPIVPSKSEEVSLYREEIKRQAANWAHLPRASVENLARSHALSALADWQFEVFIKHHLGGIANMPIISTCPTLPSPDRVEQMRIAKKESIEQERQAKCQRAVGLLTEMEILTESEIRKQSVQGLLVPIPTEQLAHEFANGLLQAVGWNGEIDRQIKSPLKDFIGVEKDIAIKMAHANINPNDLEKWRRGWLSVHYPQVVADMFSKSVVNDIELTTVKDDRFRGRLLNALLIEIANKHFTEACLAATVREVLSPANGFPTFLEKLHHGALGATTYRQTRFLGLNDKGVVDWVQTFISEWYPARIAKKDGIYALVLAKNSELKLKSFKCWTQHHGIEATEPLPILYNKQPLPKPPDPHAEHKEQARKMKHKGYTREIIARETGLSLGAVSKATTGMNVDKKKARKREACRLHTEENLTHREIAKRLGVKSHTTIGRWIKQQIAQQSSIR